ncbi:MAG: putative acid phosphatase precursor, partial [Myxococcales bacterium]|nr:putative acid phosphatase precursor [Myxococcales bacterium]
MNRFVDRLRCCLVIATVGAGCALNSAGNLGATRLGDTSHPIERGSPIAELRKACGTGARTAAGSVIHREPYLQQVTPTSAMLGWVTMKPEGERVVVTTPNGGPVAAVTADVKLGAQRTAGEKQMWARIEGLQPDTVYCYEVTARSPLTKRTGFRTAPAADTPKPIRFLAFGDSGGGTAEQSALRDQMYDVPFDFIIHTGDIAYDNGAIGEFEDNVFGVYAELFRNLALFPSAGNHDYKTMEGAPFSDVFALGGRFGEKWYSYDWGRIHFAALDTEADYATQAAWLDADLEANQRPWTIVYMHRPLYSSGEHGSDLPLRNALAPILEKHHVQLVLTGHDHDYERMQPQHGVAYVVTGGGGRGTRGVGASGFTAFSEQVIHFLVVEVGVDQLVVHAID